MLYQLQKHAMRAGRMNERDAGIVSALSRYFVDQPHSGSFELRKRRFDIVNPNGDVMQSFAAFRNELPNRRIRPYGFEQLKPALADIEHGNADALIVDLIGARHFQTQHLLIHFRRIRYGFYRDTQMIYFHELLSL
jgi:hypothetical protein